MNILVIGAGNLGRRHLQALAKLNKNIILYVIDPTAEARQLAKLAYDEVKTIDSPQHIVTYTDVEFNHTIFDVCIIATNARERLVVLQNLLRHHTVRNIILEKVAFQSAQQITIAMDLLKEFGVNAWVNCPRRMFDIYIKINKLLMQKEKIRMHVSGVNWGLCCNSIHFIDLFSHLSQCTDYSINVDGVEKTIFISKRLGYSEFFGEIKASFANGNILTLSCSQGEPSPVDISIHSDDLTISISESTGVCLITYSNGERERIDFTAPYQSNLTNEVVQKIITTGECDLANFAVSAALHKPFLNELLLFFKNFDSSIENCPIT